MGHGALRTSLYAMAVCSRRVRRPTSSCARSTARFHEATPRRLVLLVVAWAWVGVPFAYGVDEESALKVAKLFGG